MRLTKSLVLFFPLLFSGAPVAAQLADDELAAELDALAADENGNEEATTEPEPAAAPETRTADTPSDTSDLPVAGETGEGTKSALATKLASLAAEGNGEAAYHLGMMYLLGLDGTEKDPQQAFGLFKQAEEAGDPLGAYRLGDFYDGEGQGVVEPDPALALQYKRIAADAGYAVAQENVARLLYEQDQTDEALQYLLASAKQGYQPALQALASLYSGEGKIAKDPVKVYAYVALLQASAGGEPSKRLQAWRDKMQAELTEEQLKQAVAIVSGWKVEPSELTQKALTGESAARRLAGLDEVPEAIRADTKEAREGR